MLVYSLTGGIVAGGIAFLLPSYYQASATFQAEAPPTPQLSGSLAGLASQLTSLPLGSQNSAQFLGDVLTDEAIMRRVAAATFPWNGRTATLAEVYGFQKERPDWREYYTVQKLRKAIAVDVNIRTNVVHFSVEARTPVLSAALAESLLAVLNLENIELRQARAAAERQFTSARLDAARTELDSSEENLTAFYQRNRAVSGSPTLQLEESRLKRATDMAQQLYLQLRLQEEQAALQEVRNTPSISVIDPPIVPVKRSWPQRRVAVLIGLVLGACGATLRLMLLE